MQHLLCFKALAHLIDSSRYSQQNYIVLICFDSHVIMTVGGAIQIWQIIIISYNRNAISAAYCKYHVYAHCMHGWQYVIQAKVYILFTVFALLSGLCYVSLCFPVCLIIYPVHLLFHYLSHYLLSIYTPCSVQFFVLSRKCFVVASPVFSWFFVWVLN